jgi:hypothetical protein
MLRLRFRPVLLNDEDYTAQGFVIWIFDSVLPKLRPEIMLSWLLVDGRKALLEFKTMTWPWSWTNVSF